MSITLPIREVQLRGRLPNGGRRIVKVTDEEVDAIELSGDIMAIRYTTGRVWLEREWVRANVLDPPNTAQDELERAPTVNERPRRRRKR